MEKTRDERFIGRMLRFWATALSFCSVSLITLLSKYVFSCACGGE